MRSRVKGILYSACVRLVMLYESEWDLAKLKLNVIRLERTESRMFIQMFSARPKDEISPVEFRWRLKMRTWGQEGQHEDLKEWKVSKEVAKDKNAWKSLRKICLKHACARNRHKSEYDDDGVVTLNLNMKFHVQIFYYILNIIILLLLHYCCELVW